MMKRREFLRRLGSFCAAAAASRGANLFGPRMGFAEEPTGKTLVVVFQRGGADGLNTVVPYADPFYHVLRPTIGIAPPSPSDPGSAIDLDGFFGLHPAVADLLPIWSNGHLAIFPAVEYPKSWQSHFVGQQLIESGAGDTRDIDGWLNRHLVTQPRSAAMRAVSLGLSLDHALRGSAIVSSFYDVSRFTLSLPADDEQALLADLSQVYDQSTTSGCGDKSRISEYGRVLINDLAILGSLDTESYVPENGAVYPASPYGRQLRLIAQLLKADLGLEVATLSAPHFDTHTAQGASDGPLASSLKNFAAGIRAFYEDLGPRTRDVTVLTMTEFGRTAAENASLGTDHGHASAWFAVGQSLNGGIYGEWPGLGEEKLVIGRYLDHSIDYRDILGEVLTRHLGNPNLETILPGHGYRPIGFL